MKITTDYPGLKDLGWALELNGDLISDEGIEIDVGNKWLKVTGKIISRLRIEAGSGIDAGKGIVAGWGIKAGWGIEAGEGIKAGWGIEAGEGIKAGWGILAGLSVRCKKTVSFKYFLFAGAATWKKTTPDEQEVECLRMEGEGEVKHGTVRLLEVKE